MSMYGFAMSLLLVGQLGASDRYGAPPAVEPPPSRFEFDDAAPFSTDAPASSGVNPFAEKPRDVSPPPPRAESPRTRPATTPEDYGLGRPRNSLPNAGADAKSTLAPSAMMRAMLTAPPGARLAGQAVTLTEVVAAGGSRAAQTQRIDAYWDLCSSVADYYLGLREQDELQRLRAMVPKVGPTWQQAETELGVRIGTSQRGAVAAQYRLASLMGRSDASSLPLPGDMPHCGDYFVRYDQIFAGRPSPEAQQLSELLPLRYEELRDAAAAVTRAEEWLSSSASPQAGNADGTGILRALELLALRRRAFVQIVRDYNRRIARYTELASPGEIGSDRLIGMLIKRDGAPSTATRPTTTTPSYNRQSQTTPEVPARTFDEDWTPVAGTPPAATRRDEAVEPASVNKPRTSEPRRERSLLVPSSR